MTDSNDAPKPRSGLLRWVLRLGVLFLFLAVAALLARNFLIRKGAEAAVTEVTGFPFTIGSFDLGLFNARVEIGDMQLRNPTGFEDPRCLDIPRVVADLDGKSLFHETLHIQEMVLDVQEVVVVRNTAGETNLDRLKAVGDSKKEGEGKPPAEKSGGKEGGDKAPAKKHAWKCDRLELTLGKVTYLDFSRMKGGKPTEETFDLGVHHEEFRNIHDAGQIVRIIVLKILKGTPIRMMNATIDSLSGSLKDISSGIGSAVGGGVKGIGDSLGGLFGGSKDDPEKAPAKTKKKR